MTAGSIRGFVSVGNHNRVQTTLSLLSYYIYIPFPYPGCTSACKNRKSQLLPCSRCGPLNNVENTQNLLAHCASTSLVSPPGQNHQAKPHNGWGPVFPYMGSCSSQYSYPRQHPGPKAAFNTHTPPKIPLTRKQAAMARSTAVICLVLVAMLALSSVASAGEHCTLKTR